jgi:hypothetical protein
MTDRWVASGIALAAALGATTARAAEAQAGQRYRLVEVAGHALPVEVEKEWRCREYVTRATLTLGADSLWTLRYTKREVCGERAEVETELEGGRYSLEGGTIRFHEDDDGDDRDWNLGRDLDVDDLDTATRNADGALAARLRDGVTTLVFRP